ncbi:MAG: AlpA family phage regulatory protein [Rudaea sp.]
MASCRCVDKILIRSYFRLKQVKVSLRNHKEPRNASNRADSTHRSRYPENALSRSQIYRLIALKDFPTQIRLGVRAAGWIEDEIDRWLLDRIDKTRGMTASGSVAS